MVIASLDTTIVYQGIPQQSTEFISSTSNKLLPRSKDILWRNPSEKWRLPSRSKLANPVLSRLYWVVNVSFCRKKYRFMKHRHDTKMCIKVTHSFYDTWAPMILSHWEFRIIVAKNIHQCTSEPRRKFSQDISSTHLLDYESKPTKCIEYGYLVAQCTIPEIICSRQGASYLSADMVWIQCQ